jgi:rod shape-determining protein MreD
MNALRMTLVALILLVLQMTLAHRIAIAGAVPDLMIILVVALVLPRGPVFAVIVGFLLGFLQDLGNASFLGMNALAKSVIAYGIARLGGGLLPESVVFKGFVVVAACLVNDLLTLCVTMSFSVGAIAVSFFRYSILSAVYTGVIGVAVYAAVELLTRRVVRSGAGF